METLQGSHPAENNVVRNLEVEVSTRYDGSLPYKHQKPYTLSRHVSKLIVIATIEEDKVDYNPIVSNRDDQAKQKSSGSG